MSKVARPKLGTKKERLQNKEYWNCHKWDYWRIDSRARQQVLKQLRRMNVPEIYFAGIDVARVGKLKSRAEASAAEGRTDPLIIKRGLVVVDGKNNIMLIHLPTAVPEG